MSNVRNTSVLSFLKRILPPLEARERPGGGPIDVKN